MSHLLSKKVHIVEKFLFSCHVQCVYACKCACAVQQTKENPARGQKEGRERHAKKGEVVQNSC